MAEVDATILSLLRQDTTMDADGLGSRGSGEGGGRTASRMVLTDMVTQLQSLVESAEKSAQSAVQHRDTMRMELEAAHQEHFAFEVRQEELETQNFHLKAELAKSQRQDMNHRHQLMEVRKTKLDLDMKIMKCGRTGGVDFKL